MTLSHAYTFLCGPSHGQVSALLIQLCPSICNPVDGSPPGSSVHGILAPGQAHSPRGTRAAVQSLPHAPFHFRFGLMSLADMFNTPSRSDGSSVISQLDGVYSPERGVGGRAFF